MAWVKSSLEKRKSQEEESHGRENGSVDGGKPPPPPPQTKEKRADRQGSFASLPGSRDRAPELIGKGGGGFSGRPPAPESKKVCEADQRGREGAVRGESSEGGSRRSVVGGAAQGGNDLQEGEKFWRVRLEIFGGWKGEKGPCVHL